MTDPTPDVPTLRRLLAEATPGPYRSAEQLHGEWFGIQSEHFALGTAFHPADAALIVAAVNALSGILDRLEAAEGAVARVDIAAVLDEHYTWRAVGQPGEGWACRCGVHLAAWWPEGGVRLRESAPDVALRGHVATALRAALAEVTP